MSDNTNTSTSETNQETSNPYSASQSSNPNNVIPQSFLDSLKGAVVDGIAGGVAKALGGNGITQPAKPNQSGSPGGQTVGGKIIDFILKPTLNMSSLKQALGGLAESAGKDIGASIDKALASLTNTDVKVGLNLDQNLFPTLKKIKDLPIFREENLFKVTAVVGTRSAIQGVKSLLGPILDLEKDLKAVEKQGVEAFSQFALAGPQDTRITAMGNQFNKSENAAASFKLAVSDVVNETLVDYKTAAENIATFAREGFSPDAMKGFSLEAGKTGKSISAVTDAMKIASVTGLSLKEIAENLKLQTRSLGTEQDKTTDLFGDATELSRKYNVQVGEIARGTMKATETLKYFGDTTKGVTDLYNKMLGALGKGKSSLAQELVQELTHALSGLDSGIKAFIGMTTGIGGGRGAIGSSLEVEEAIAKGDLSKVIDGITGQIEKISGTKVLSRREALDTGQDQQFFLQRELVKQMLGLKDQQASLFLEAKSRGEQINIEDLKTDTGKKILSETGGENIGQQTGPIQGALNKAEMDSLLNMTSGLSKDLTDTAHEMLDSSTGFVKTSDTLAKVFGTSTRELKGINESLAKIGGKPRSTQEQIKLELKRGISEQQGAALPGSREDVAKVKKQQKDNILFKPRSLIDDLTAEKIDSSVGALSDIKKHQANMKAASDAYSSIRVLPRDLQPLPTRARDFVSLPENSITDFPDTKVPVPASDTQKNSTLDDSTDKLPDIILNINIDGNQLQKRIDLSNERQQDMIVGG